LATSHPSPPTRPSTPPHGPTKGAMAVRTMTLLCLVAAASAYRGKALVHGAVDGIAEKLITAAVNGVLRSLPGDVRIDAPVALRHSFRLPLNQSANYSLASSGVVLSRLDTLSFRLETLARTASGADANASIGARRLSLSSGLSGAVCVDERCVRDVHDGSVEIDLRVAARMRVGLKSVLGVPVVVQQLCIGPITKAEAGNATVTGLGGMFDAVAAQAVDGCMATLEAPLANELEKLIEGLQPSCSFPSQS